jgi:AmpE protein
MTLFTCLILIFSFNFGLFKEKYSLSSILVFLSSKILDPEKELNKIRFFIVLLSPSIIVLFFSLFLYFGINSFYGAVLTLIFWVVITYFCFNQHEPWEHYQNLLRAVDEKNATKLISIAKSASFEAAEFDMDFPDPQAVAGLTAAWMNYRYLLAPLFYLATGGIFAPTLVLFYSTTYYFLGQKKYEPLQPELRKILFILDWVPCRIMSLSYLVTGNFGRAMMTYMKMIILPFKKPHEILMSVAEKALFIEYEETENKTPQVFKAYIELAYRSSILLLLLIAFLTIVGVIY